MMARVYKKAPFMADSLHRNVPCKHQWLVYVIFKDRARGYQSKDSYAEEH
jgi:hypothetical protein